MALQSADYMSFLNDDSEIPTDVSFKVFERNGEEDQSEVKFKIFRGHKLLLSVASPVFRRQFFGSLPEKADPILVEDTTCEAFNIMIEFIYKKVEHFNFTCKTFAGLFEVRNISEKYQIAALVTKVEQEIACRQLSRGNLIEAAESAKNYSHFSKVSEELTLRCKNYFTKNYRTVEELRAMLTEYQDNEINTDILIMLIKSQPANCHGCKRMSTECLDGKNVTRNNMTVGVKVIRNPNATDRTNDSQGVGVIMRKDERKENCWYVRWETNKENGDWLINTGGNFIFKCH